MESVVSVRRVAAAAAAVVVVAVATALAAPGLLCFLDPLPAAEAEPFESIAVVEITTIEGDTLKGNVCGDSTPGGEFAGPLCETLVGLGAGAVGMVTFVYETGSLTLFFSDAVSLDDQIEGAWHVLEGTGDFAGATGGGEISGFFVPTPPDDVCGSDGVITFAIVAATGTIVR